MRGKEVWALEKTQKEEVMEVLRPAEAMQVMMYEEEEEEEGGCYYTSIWVCVYPSSC